MHTIDIPPLRLAILFLMLCLPLLLLHRLRLGLSREVLVGVARMSLQLALVGLYLKYLFDLNSWWLTGLWVAAIILVANYQILRKAGLAVGGFFWPTLAGVALATMLVLGIFLVLVVRPEPLYDARYLIPLAGMLVGNSMSGNILSLERFYSRLRSDENRFLSYLLMGASLKEAVAPFAREAVRRSIAPTIATMATMGLVSLPGMMTGQILGGSFPLVAIKYQIMVMLGIFSSMTISMVTNIYLTLPVAFDQFQMLRPEVFSPAGSQQGGPAPRH